MTPAKGATAMKVTGCAVYNGRVKQGRRSRSWPMARLMSLAVILGLAFLPEAARAVRPQRTVFHTQPVEWNPEVDEDHKPPALVFQPSWTTSAGGLRSEEHTS